MNTVARRGDQLMLFTQAEMSRANMDRGAFAFCVSCRLPFRQDVPKGLTYVPCPSCGRLLLREKHT